MEEVEGKHGSIVIICEMSLPTIFNCKQFSIRKRRIFEYIKPTSTHNRYTAISNRSTFVSQFVIIHSIFETLEPSISQSLNQLLNQPVLKLYKSSIAQFLNHPVLKLPKPNTA